VGWLFTQASAWLGTRQADQRTIKETLYSLLELQNLLNGLVQLNARLPFLVTLFRKQFPIAPPPEVEAAVDELIAKLLRDSFVPLISQQLSDLNESYHASLLKLAPLDPVSAYHLRGQADVMQKLPLLLQGLQAAGAKHLDSTTPPPPSLIAFFQQHLEADELVEARDTVRKAITQLSQQLTKRTQLAVAEVLSSKEPTEQEQEAWAADYMQHLREAMPELIKQQ
jgi:hypothetical protein